MDFNVRPAEAVVTDLEAASGLIGLLKDVAPASGAAFDAEYLAPIRRMAGWVLDLPACPEHHADPGGLLRYAVQAGYFALRLADGVVFGGDLPAERRRVVDRESRRAAFLAALASPAALAHRYLTVTSADGEIWSEFSSPAALGAWAAERGGRYTVGWRHAPVEPVRTVEAWIAGDLMAPVWGEMDPGVIRAAMAAIAPDERPQGQESPLQKIVRQALEKSAEAARKAAAARYMAPAEPLIPRPEQVVSAIPPGPSPQPTPAPSAPEGVTSNRAEAPPIPGDEIAAHQLRRIAEEARTSPLNGVSKAVRELLQTLAEDIREKDAVRKRVGWDESGQWLSIDLNLFGAYGVTPAGVAAALKKAKLAEDGNGRSLRLVESVGVMLLPKGG